MMDAEILALLRRARELAGQYKAAGYVVSHSAAEHPKWSPDASGE